ncbi:MAG: peptidase C14, partial [Okeania sp. SIO3H1]|nr:peptidase C14 [Okeania sp. SIO3H1]
KYKFIPPLKYAANDAKKMRDFLLNKAGFDEVLHYSDYSSNSYEYPGRSDIEIQLEEVGNLSMGSDDHFWFFFSGHGSINGGLDYLMLSDTHEDIQKSAISVNYVIQQLKKCGAGNVVLFLDMCRDKGIKSIERPGEQTKQKARQMGMISFFSCSSNEYSWELQEKKHGAFTYALLKLLGKEKG